MKKRVISLANLLLFIAFICVNHLQWISIDFKFYFPLLFCFIAVRYQLPKSTYKPLHDLWSGYLIGWAIEVILIKIYSQDESHTGEILCIVFVALGWVYRRYKDQTQKAAIFTTIGYWIKKIVALIFDSIFG